MRLFFRICRFLYTFVMAVIITGSLFFIIMRVFSYEPLSIMGGSMEPAYKVGGLVFVNKKVTAAEVGVGDVCAFRMGDSTILTHRVTRIDNEGKYFNTKGDANESEDFFTVPFDSLIGRADFSFWYGGRAAYLLSTKGHALALIVGGALILIQAAKKLGKRLVFVAAFLLLPITGTVVNPSEAFFSSTKHAVNTITFASNEKAANITLIQPNWEEISENGYADANGGVLIPNDPMIINNGEADVYVRIKLYIDDVIQGKMEISGFNISPSEENGYWIEGEEEGVYYYSRALLGACSEPYDETVPLFTHVRFVQSENAFPINDLELSIIIEAEAVTVGNYGTAQEAFTAYD